MTNTSNSSLLLPFLPATGQDRNRDPSNDRLTSVAYAICVGTQHHSPNAASTSITSLGKLCSSRSRILSHTRLVCGSNTPLQSARLVPRHPACDVLIQTDDIVNTTEPHKTANLIGRADSETKVAVQVPHQTQPWLDLTPDDTWRAIPP